MTALEHRNFYPHDWSHPLTLKLEPPFQRMLEGMASERGLTVNALLREMHDEKPERMRLQTYCRIQCLAWGLDHPEVARVLIGRKQALAR